MGVNFITSCTTYIYEDVKISFYELMSVTVMPIKGTMKIDFVVSSENGVMYCRDTACLCVNCSGCKNEKIKFGKMGKTHSPYPVSR